jgi:hypothetical protein
MDHIIQDINELCSKDIHLCFADNKVRLSRAFYHVLVMDGAEVAAALLCDVNQCPVCTCPHSELDQTDVAYPYRDTESVKRAVSAARSEHLDADGEVKDRHKEEVAHFIQYPVRYHGRYHTRHHTRYNLTSYIYFFQVEKLVRLLKHKIRSENAYFKAHDFDFILSATKEELHQFFIGLYGDHLLPATMHEIEKLLRGPDTIKGFNKDKKTQYVISKNRLKVVWKRLRDRLASVDSSTSTIEITNDYAAHFYDMYINKHDGKHTSMTDDRMKILLLNLPFLLRDLVAPEVRLYIIYDITHDIRSDIVSDVIPLMYPMSYMISLLTSATILFITPPDVPLALTDQVDQC